MLFMLCIIFNLLNKLIFILPYKLAIFFQIIKKGLINNNILPIVLNIIKHLNGMIRIFHNSLQIIMIIDM